MNKELLDTLELFKKEIDSDVDAYHIVDEPDFQMFDYLDLVEVGWGDCVEEMSPLNISFYHGCTLPFAANVIKTLMENGITKFEIMSCVYLDWDDEGVCQGMLFDDEAETRYKEDIYKEIQQEKFKKFNPINSKKEKNIGQPDPTTV